MAVDGVVAAYSGADLQELWGAPMPCAWPVTPDMKNPAHYPVTPDVARYVGDAVAVVLALLTMPPSMLMTKKPKLPK